MIFGKRSADGEPISSLCTAPTYVGNKKKELMLLIVIKN